MNRYILPRNAVDDYAADADALLVCCAVAIGQWIYLPGNLLTMPVTASALYTVALAILFVAAWIVRPFGASVLAAWLWPFGLVLFHSVVSALWTGLSVESTQQILAVIVFIASFAISVRAFSRSGRLSWLGGTLLWGGVGTSLSYLYSVYSEGFGAMDLWSPRSFAIVALAPFCWASCRLRSRGWNFGNAVAALLVLAAIVFSLSRTALVVAVFSIVAAQFDRASPKRIFRVVVTGCFLSVMLVAGIAYFAPLRDRFLQGDLALRIGGFTVNTMGRMRAWNAIAANVADSPLLGHGTGSSRPLMRVLSSDTLAHPHNDYLRIVYEFGIVGLACWAIALANLLIRTHAAYRNASANRLTITPVHGAAFVLLCAYTAVMATDNAMVYVPFQVALGAIVGASCGAVSSTRANGPVWLLQPDGRLVSIQACPEEVR